MKTIQERLAQYRRNYSVIARSHYIAANRLGWLNTFWGTVAVVLSTIVCATIFISVAQALPQWGNVATGIASLGVAILTFIQLQHRFGERSAAHRSAAAKFADLRRRIELAQHKYERDSDETRAAAIADLEQLLKEFAILGELCPKLDDKDHKKAESEYKSDHGIGAEALLHSKTQPNKTEQDNA
jgi:hypothetical protein